MQPTPTLKSKPKAHPDSVNGCLARTLDSDRNDIINEWLDQVRSDPAIPTNSLTREEVRDPLPKLVNDLTETLSRYGCEIVAEQSAKDVENHGVTRLQQGFQLPEMLREMMHLRSILIHRLGVFESGNEDFGMVARLFVTTTVHKFIDRMEINATEQFIRREFHQKTSHHPQTFRHMLSGQNDDVILDA